jgi:AraC family transcriptional regulator
VTLKENAHIAAHSRTVLDYRRRINVAMQFVNENWGDPLDIASVAEAARYSPFHFHRVFAGFVGETLADYIRKVRMRKSASLLLAGETVADIAMATGYKTASAFSRSFKQTTGLTPSQFQNIEQVAQVNFQALPSLYRMTGHLELVPRILTQPAFTFYYLPRKIGGEGLLNENIGRSFREAFDKWAAVLQSRALLSCVSKRMGVIRGVSSLCPEQCQHDAGIVFDRPVSLDGLTEIQQTHVAAGRWAVFVHKGPYTTLWQTWSWIYNHWRWVSGYRIRPGEAHEVYLNNQRLTAADDLLTELFVPID